jgi:hypothetical protein
MISRANALRLFISMTSSADTWIRPRLSWHIIFSVYSLDCGIRRHDSITSYQLIDQRGQQLLWSFLLRSVARMRYCWLFVAPLTRWPPHAGTQA